MIQADVDDEDLPSQREIKGHKPIPPEVFSRFDIDPEIGMVRSRATGRDRFTITRGAERVFCGKGVGHIYKARLIYEFYHGPIPYGHIVVHMNGDKRDDRIENLSAMPRNDYRASSIPHAERINFRGVDHPFFGVARGYKEDNYKVTVWYRDPGVDGERKSQFVGYFNDPVTAARAYDRTLKNIGKGLLNTGVDLESGRQVTPDRYRIFEKEYTGKKSVYLIDNKQVWRPR